MYVYICIANASFLLLFEGFHKSKQANKSKWISGELAGTGQRRNRQMRSSRALAQHDQPGMRPDASKNFTREECLSIERGSSVRRSAKVVNVQETNPAYLHCAVPHATENLVAWTRLSDDALLTAGGQSFTSDVRFQISPKRHAKDWVLIIRRVQISDSGCYLCEVNTDPASTLYPVFLNVLPTQELVSKSMAPHKSSAKLMVKMQGNALFLNCSVEMADKELMPTTVTWTRDSNVIELNDETKYQSDYQIQDHQITYQLRINSVSHIDDGLYACEGESVPRASQMVRLNSNGATRPNSITTLSLLILLFYLFTNRLIK
uniref:Ig-like domain-containing protein n=1 Tax=Panagrellus redivivus TaxID=6233 RepID=A0A7E4VMY0_PANRE